MKKLFFTLISSIMLLFVIWFIIGWIRYEDEIFNKHLDLYATLQRLNMLNLKSFNQITLYELINKFRGGFEILQKANFVQKNLEMNGVMQDTSIGFQVILTAVTSLIDPVFSIAQSFYVLTYLIVIVIYLLYFITNMVISIGEFILSPVFIENTISQARNLFNLRL